MQAISIQNERFKGADGRESLYDLTIPENWNDKIVVFIHGYMGYKDWGCWSLVENFFTSAGYGFLKYNVSHNGGTVTNPIDFDDLDAFSRNTYSKELADFEAITSLVHEIVQDRVDFYVIGHSRGGGIALLQSEHPAVKKIAALAAICSVGERFPPGELLEKWKIETIKYRENGRTHQNMPHHIDQYNDYIANQDRLNIEAYCKSSKVPTIVIHGDADTSIGLVDGEQIASWLNVDLIVLEGEQHTFGSTQPWQEKELSLGLRDACQQILQFFETEHHYVG
ncbi:MAG: pimeloyl-ACP methyl ester carboxylesterase [Crocinitomicaceae bacterium]|jgi:pimeloyl-ACP methyl ester carboxylesterase